VNVLYFGQPIANSPFTAKSWDSTKVNVTPIASGNVGLQSAFNSEYYSDLICIFLNANISNVNSP